MQVLRVVRLIKASPMLEDFCFKVIFQTSKCQSLHLNLMDQLAWELRVSYCCVKNEEIYIFKVYFTESCGEQCVCVCVFLFSHRESH